MNPHCGPGIPRRDIGPLDLVVCALELRMLVSARRLPTTIVGNIKTGITTMPPAIIPALPLFRIRPSPESLPPTVPTDLLTVSGVLHRHNHHITGGGEACLESAEKRIAEIRIVLVSPGTHPGKEFTSSMACAMRPAISEIGRAHV